MANRKRETPEEKARRERQERIELLKMKQGLIEESETIPETGYVKFRELHGWEKVTNFFYHNKAFIILGTFFAVVLAILVGQLITKEKEDLYILALAFDKDSEIGWRTQDLEKALEKYCPDFDGNGKVHVAVNYIDRTSDNIVSEYDQAQAQKLTAEFVAAEAQLIIADEKFVDWVCSEYDTDKEALSRTFLDQTDKCPEDMLYKACGVRLNQTGFAEEARWKSCPDNVVLLIRSELNNGAGNVKKNAKNRERAMIVLQNILDGNVVNPEAESE